MTAEQRARAAVLRMQRLVPTDDRIKFDPVLRADSRTSMNDARIALCVARGIALEDIDAASGHDWSRRGYESVRQSWRIHAADVGAFGEWSQAAYEEAFARWAERRPEFTDGDDWLAGLAKPADNAEGGAL